MNTVTGYLLMVLVLALLGAGAAWLPRLQRPKTAQADNDAQVAYDLGFSAGYCGTSKDFNPYRRGWLRTMADLGDRTSTLASQWDAGNADGRQAARDDFHTKLRDDLRSDAREP